MPSRRDQRARPRGASAVGWAAFGVLGEVLMTLGVLIGLFVVWQLWWTDVAAGQEQAQAVADLGWEEPVTVPEPVERTDAPPVLEEPEELTTFATLQVPRWGEDYVQPITQGVGQDVLDHLGVGHYPGTAMPGGVGNHAVAAHRVTYGKPFNRVAELELGDPLVVRTEDTWYVYRVTSTEIVLPHQVEVIAPVPGEPEAVPTERRMTLTTCHPMFSAEERFIVHAELDHWMPVADGTPAALDGGA
ncbi:class E sortase [Actinotalea soli]|nr:class E sortase [Actinotalea soli]